MVAIAALLEKNHNDQLQPIFCLQLPRRVSKLSQWRVIGLAGRNASKFQFQVKHRHAKPR